MKAGKDVYCEKPLTLTIDEGSLICKATKETGRVFQVGTQQRSSYDGCFLETVAIARSGRLGNRLQARCTIGGGVASGPFPVEDPPRGLDWDLWLGQAPQVPFCAQRGLRGGFRQWLDYAGGITDWGAHHIDIALWALGGEDTGVVEVAGKGEFPLGRQLTLDYLLGKKSPRDLPNGSNVATAFDCTMKLPNGNAIAFVSGDHDDIFIGGQEGHLAVNRGGIRGKFVEALKRDTAEKEWLDREVARLYKGKPRRGHMANFLDCVKDRSLPISDVFTHRNSINACHMANIAMLLGRKIQWSPDRQRFVGDDEANQLTRRTQRKPYLIA
jgi:predicted dehydrogenase